MAFDLAAFGGKLKRFRTEQQFSVGEVERSTGLSAARLGLLEAGESTPSGDEVLILADFYKCDFRFLISNERLAASEQTASLYRRYGEQFTKTDRRSVQEFLFLCECEQVLWEELELSHRTFTFHPAGNYFKGHGDQAASALRAHFGYTGNAVPSDVFDDFRKLGFHVFRRRLQNSAISGITIRHPFAGICLLINHDEDLYRQRFTAAHEAAHGILDRDEDVIVSFAKGFSQQDLVEIRANKFASSFLLPQSVVQALPVGAWNKEAIILWASRFKVSSTALAIALREVGAINQSQVDHLSQARVPHSLKSDPELASLDAESARRKQALLERGLSTSYVKLCFEALNRGLITGGKAADMLLVDQFGLVELATLYRVNLQV